jgi:hypothetical protein
MTGVHRGRRTVAVALTLVAAALLMGCGGGEYPTPTTLPVTTTPTPTPTHSPTPSVDPAIAVAQAAVLAAYRDFWAAKVAWYGDPRAGNDSNLSQYAIDAALADAQSTVFTFRTDGIEVPGEPVLSPKVSGVTLGDAPRATVNDCIDTSNWQAIFRESRKSAVAPGQLTRVVAVAEATIFDGRWVIRSYAAQRDRAC